MTEPFDLADLDWDSDIWSARRGDVTRLIAALRSGRSLGAHERMVRDFLAALLAGELRRKRGPKRTWTKMDQAEDLVLALKMCARANGKVRGVGEAAIKLAVREYGVSEDALCKRLQRGRKKVPH